MKKILNLELKVKICCKVRDFIIGIFIIDFFCRYLLFLVFWECLFLLIGIVLLERVLYYLGLYLFNFLLYWNVYVNIRFNSIIKC